MQRFGETNCGKEGRVRLFLKPIVMATIIPQPLGKSNANLHTVKIDMTPMVDLGFLLITFFIFTASLTQPAVTKLAMPKADSGAIDVYEPTLLTAVLHKDKVFVYEGALQKAVTTNGLKQTDYNVQTGLGNFVRQKQKRLEKSGLKEEMTVVIKPTPSASYQALMNALDEMLINGVSHYSVVDASPTEKEYLATHHH